MVLQGMKIYPDYSPDMGAMYQNNLVLLRLSKPVKDVKVPALASPSMVSLSPLSLQWYYSVMLEAAWEGGGFLSGQSSIRDTR